MAHVFHHPLFCILFTELFGRPNHGSGEERKDESNAHNVCWWEDLRPFSLKTEIKLKTMEQGKLLTGLTSQVRYHY